MLVTLEAICGSGNHPRLSLQSYAIIGAAASLGGATRMTISICVLVMETTGALQLIVPIMLSIMCAKGVGDYFGLGIYDTHIEIRGAPFLVRRLVIMRLNSLGPLSIFCLQHHHATKKGV